MASVAQAASANADYASATLDYLIGAIRANDGALRDLSNEVERVRSSDIPGAIGAVFFAIAVLPEMRGIGKLYERMLSKYPLPAWREGRVRNEDIENARRAIFFYLLFLLYQAVQFPLTWGPSNTVEVVADLLVQVTLLGLILDKYAVVRQSLFVRNDGNREKRDKVVEWLTEKFEGMSISFATLRRKTILIFIASISLLFAQLLPAFAGAILFVLEALKAALGMIAIME